MSDENPTLKDIWRVMGTFNKRFDMLNSRLDAHARQLVQLRAELQGQMAAGFGSLKASIEALDFRLDEHGRRLNELESKT